MDKPLQVGQGLGDRETALRGRELVPEHVERDLVRRARFGGEGGNVIVQPVRWCSISSRARVGAS